MFPGGIPIDNSIKVSKTRLQVYALLSEGKAQRYVAGLLTMSTGTIGYHAKELEAEGYIQRVKGCSNPVLFEKGPKAADLDRVVISSNIRINATGVTQHSKKSAKVRKAKVHHLKFRLNVEHEGSIEWIKAPNGDPVPFLRQYQDYRNVQRYTGKVPHKDGLVTVEYEVTPNQKTFYIYPPEMDLDVDGLDHYEEIAASACCEISAYVQRNAGWVCSISRTTAGLRNPARYRDVSAIP